MRRLDVCLFINRDCWLYTRCGKTDSNASWCNTSMSAKAARPSSKTLRETVARCGVSTCYAHALIVRGEMKQATALEAVRSSFVEWAVMPKTTVMEHCLKFQIRSRRRSFQLPAWRCKVKFMDEIAVLMDRLETYEPTKTLQELAREMPLV